MYIDISMYVGVPCNGKCKCIVCWISLVGGRNGGDTGKGTIVMSGAISM